jgi:septal ring factor EnvC (AmiA/AmiB activator)
MIPLADVYAPFSGDAMKINKTLSLILCSLLLGAGVFSILPVSADTEIEKVEKEIKVLEYAVALCAARLDGIKPPGINATAAEQQAYEKELQESEKCIAQLERRLNDLRKRLADLLSRLPAVGVGTPREDPETKRQREKIAQCLKRVAESEKRKNELKARLEALLKRNRR